MKILQCLLAAFGMLILVSAAGAPASSKFTYQGLLEQSSAPANGVFDLRFEPFSAISGGSLLATAIVVDNVVVSNGVFTATLDFGEGFFVGDQVFLDIGVRIGTSTGSFTTLTPRQEITATPYAQTALALADTGTGQGFAERIGFTETRIAGVSAQSPSVVIGADGFPIISFYDPVQGDLRVAHCTDRACRSSEVFTIDPTGIVGEFNSITIRWNGLPAISYYDRSNGNLKLAYCLTRSCSTSSLQVIDSSGDVGQYTSIVSGDAFSAPLMIFYHDVTNGDLKSARCGVVSCATPTLAVMDSTGTVGRFTSAALGGGIGDGAIAWVAYYDATNTAMKAMACHSFGCGAGQIIVTPKVIENGVTAVNSSSVAIGGDNRAWITYNAGTTVHMARCESRYACSGPAVTTLDNIYGYVASTTGLDGVVWTAGRWGDGRVRTGRCEGTSGCSAYTAWSTSLASNDQPNPLSIALGVDGIPIIASGAASNLTVVHCSSAQSCISSYWPR